MSPSIKVAFPMAKSRQLGSQGTKQATEARAIPKPSGPSKLAQRLTLAHHVEALIEAGVLADYADAARALGVTRARLTQLQKLLLLAPELQEHVLVNVTRMAERGLRGVLNKPSWQEQATAFSSLAKEESEQ